MTDDQHNFDTNHEPTSDSVGQPPVKSGNLLLYGTALFAFVILSCGGGITLAIWNGARYQAAERQLVQEWEKFSQAWQPPAGDLEGAELFEAKLADAQLVRWDEKAEFPALKIDLPGMHAVYETDDGKQIDLHVYRATDLERKEIYRHTRELLDDPERFALSVFGGSPQTRMFKFRIAPPEMTGNFWYSPGWLILARSSAMSNRDIDQFLSEFLASIAVNGEDLPEINWDEATE
ncbi:hypothetical protein [Calycomorphotria hydatis]|uniref:Uncharacterized protein n=1 Tax=Calycomorphotria hydatis TaxID=2528027 RepID=A0A517TBE4_9PLAN|nr:hypothetical protein [Calycomorphotria hydatis]QDT65691.1 hypothetical protein V22_29510 [Calycomorphotria hydatis]